MKKNQMFRAAALLISILVMVTGFTACGSKAPEADKATPETSAAAASGTEAGTEPVKEAIKGDIKYNFWGNADQAKAIQDNVDAFSKINPDIKVAVDFADWGTYWTKLQTQAAAGNAPDVFAMSTTAWLPNYASKGFLADCGELAAKDGFDLTKYSKASLDLSSYDGKLVGMPQDINAIVLAYNSDMFAKAGLTAPDANATWDDILKMAQKLTLDKNGKNSLDAGFNKKNIEQWGIANYGFYIDGYLDPMTFSNGGSLISMDGTKSNVLEEPARKSIQFVADLVLKYNVSPDLDTVPGWTDIFAQGKCAIYPMPSYLLYGYADPSKNININYEVMQMPKGASGKNYNAVQSKGICIFSKSQNIPAAWEFVKYIASEEVYKKVVSNGAGLSPITSLNEEVFLTQSWGPKNTKKIYLDAIENACPIEKTLRLGDANTKIGETMDAIILRNKQPMDEALKKLDGELNTILTDN